MDKKCPKCGKKLLIRKNSKTGEEFYGCKGFPFCKYTESFIPLITKKTSKKDLFLSYLNESDQKECANLLIEHLEVVSEILLSSKECIFEIDNPKELVKVIKKCFGTRVEDKITKVIALGYYKQFLEKQLLNDGNGFAPKIAPSLESESKTEISKKDNFYKKAEKKIPIWAQKPNQENHKVIRAYFKAYHRFDEPPTKDMMLEICRDHNDKSCFVRNFQATYSSLKADGPTTNGRVFIDDGTNVQIWEEVEDVLLKYEKYFYNIENNN